MGSIKNYLCRVIAETTSDVLEADALEYAIYCGWINLNYDLAQDKINIGKQLLTLTEKFRAVAEENQAVNAPMQELIGQISDWK